MAFPRKNRLKDEKVIKYLIRGGKSVKRNSFFIRWTQNTFQYARVSVIVPSKISRNSVIRNKIKRILSDLFYINKLLTLPYDIIIVALKPIVFKDFKEIKTEADSATKYLFV